VTREGAVVVVGPEGRAFVRAEFAQQIVVQPTVSRVPNTGVSMALVGGRVVSVLELGEPSRALLVCEVDGETVAFSGLGIEQVGLFEIDEHGARVGTELLPELAIRELCESAAKARNGARRP
jgi:hypothetical protein